LKESLDFWRIMRYA